MTALTAATVLSAQAPPTSLTIYNDGRVLVRQSWPVPISKGISTHQLAVGALDPTSPFLLDSGVTLLSATYDGATDEASTLRRVVGQTVGARKGTSDSIAVVQVVGVDPERYALSDGRIVFGRPGQLVFSKDQVLLAPRLTLTVDARSPRRTLALGYFTSGGSWQASYTALLGGSTAKVAGVAVIGLQGFSGGIDSADVQLLAGSVSRASRGGVVSMEMDMAAARAPAAMGKMAEERAGEFHLYSVPGRVSLTPGTNALVSLFDPVSAPYERAYVVRGQLPMYGPIQQYGDENQVPVEVTYTIKRPKDGEFGKLPVPGGVFRLYQLDAAGKPQMIGESNVGHTPAGADLEVPAGVAFDLTAERVQTTYRTIRDTTAQGKIVRSGAIADYKVTLKNAGDTAATIDVLEQRSGEWSIVTSSVPPEKLSSTVTRFRVKVPAGGESVLTYRVRAVW